MSPKMGFLVFWLGISSLFVYQTSAQSFFNLPTQWQTTGVGLSTPFGFNAGFTHNIAVKGPLYVQASASFNKDVYITQHEAYMIGGAVGVRTHSDIALIGISAGPSYTQGKRGFDQLTPGSDYQTTSLTISTQILFKDLNMGFEVYSNLNPVRNVSGMRLLYRLGKLR